MTFDTALLARIIREYEADVEPLGLAGRTLAFEQAMRRLVTKHGFDAVQAAISGLNVSYALKRS